MIKNHIKFLVVLPMLFGSERSLNNISYCMGSLQDDLNNTLSEDDVLINGLKMETNTAFKNVLDNIDSKNVVLQTTIKNF